MTDGFLGPAPDIGACEFGAPPWVPGCRNAVRVLPCEEASARMHAVRVLLVMPTLAPVTVHLEAEGGGTVSPAAATFTPETWHRPVTVEVRGAARLRLRIPALGLDDTVDLADLDPVEGARSAFRTIP